MRYEIEERRLTSFDGTEIAYHVVGEGLPVLLCNGLGGSWQAWTHQIDYLADRYQFISWDYRGLYASGPPPEPAALDMRSQACDALEIMEAEGIDRAALFGWSMGVQVALEIFRAAPQKVAALVILNGVPGRPFDTLLNAGVMDKVVPPVLRGLQSIHQVVELVVGQLVKQPETVQWIKRIGLAASTLDEDVFHALADSFRDLDMKTYMKTLELLGEHDAWDVLSSIDVPTLVIAGGRDLMTPGAVAERTAQRIRGAELMIIPKGTHYAAVEYPEMINLRIEKFFTERGYTVKPSP